VSAAGPVGCQNCGTGLELGFQATRSYSLMRPPRRGRRLIRSWERSPMEWSGRVELAAAMGSSSVVVGLALGQDRPQTRFAEDQHPVGTSVRAVRTNRSA
jgi:hypothetical protein